MYLNEYWSPLLCYRRKVRTLLDQGKSPAQEGLHGILGEVWLLLDFKDRVAILVCWLVPRPKDICNLRIYRPWQGKIDITIMKDPGIFKYIQH